MADDLKALVDNQFVIGIDVKSRDNTLTALAADTCRVGVTVADISDTGTAFAYLPEDYALLEWTRPLPGVTVRVEYLTRPAIGIHDAAEIRVVLNNETDSPVEGVLTLTGDNPDIVWNWIESPVSLAPHDTLCLCNRAETGVVERMPQTNLHHLVVTTADGVVATETFGLAGAWVFKVYGPYFEPMHSVEDPQYPPCHGEGCCLPSLEAMVNNEVFLSKAYLDERKLIRGEAVAEEPLGYLNAYEDLLPLDEMMEMQGQMCCYLETDVYFKEDTEAWILISCISTVNS